MAGLKLGLGFFGPRRLTRLGLGRSWHEEFKKIGFLHVSAVSSRLFLECRESKVSRRRQSALKVLIW